MLAAFLGGLEPGMTSSGDPPRYCVDAHLLGRPTRQASIGHKEARAPMAFTMAIARRRLRTRQGHPLLGPPPRMQPEQ